MRSRYHAKAFIAYFQAFTNTFAPLHVLRERYEVIREFSEIKGLAIGTRPDCVDEEILDLVEEYGKDYEIWIEYGLQSASNRTLERILRGHTVEQFVDAVRRTSSRSIMVCAHVILGLPGEGRGEILDTARLLARLPVHAVKIHHCHVLRGTTLAEWFLKGTYVPPEKETYVSWVCDFLEHLPESILIQRLLGDAPHTLVLAPAWARNKALVLKEIQAELERRGTHQGVAIGTGWNPEPTTCVL